MEKRWATVGLMVVAIIAIFGKGPIWIGVAALMLATICLAMLWKAPKPCPQEEAAKQLENLKNR